MGRTRTSCARTPDGPRTEVSRTVAGTRRVLAARRAWHDDVDAPADHAWTVLTETRYWPDRGPSVGAVTPADATIETGTKGHVRVARAWLPFRIVRCTSRRWTWRVAALVE